MSKVSVIVPTYNRAHLISRSLRSVLEQTYRDFELLVMDDCSTDNTEEVVRGLDDSRIRYIRLARNSGGPAVPTNMGIEAAAGEYVAIQDSDDEWLPKKLEKQVAVLESASSQVGIVYTDVWRVHEKGKQEHWRLPRIMPEDGLIYKQALRYRVKGIGTQTLAIRRECFDRVGLFDKDMPNLIDTELLIRMSRCYLFFHIAEPLVNYYETAGSIISEKRSSYVARKLIFDKYYDDIRKDRRTLAFHYFQIGNALCLKGDAGEGRRYLRRAVWADPLKAKYWVSVLMSLAGGRTYGRMERTYRRAWSRRPGR